MRIALIQMQSSTALEKNLLKMETFVREAKKGGARLVVFPEMAYFTGSRENQKPIISKFNELCDTFQSWAKTYQVGLIPGTLREPTGAQSQKFFNTLVFFKPDASQTAKYQKIHLFKANLSHHQYDESRFVEAGTQIVDCDFEGWRLGFAICFDLRFPDLFQSLRKKGVQVFILPSAFTVPTGEAHWEILLRARAIENQAYVLAPDLTGISGEGLAQFGHTMAVDPWGRVLALRKSEEGVSFLDLSSETIQGVESTMTLPFG